MRDLMVREHLDPADDKLILRAKELRTPDTFRFGLIAHVQRAADLPTIHGKVVGYEAGDIVIKGLDGKEYVAHYMSDKIWLCNC